MSNDVPGAGDDPRGPGGDDEEPDRFGSDQPAGQGDQPGEGQPQNPFAGTPFEALGAGMAGAGGAGAGGAGQADLGALFGQLQQMFSWQGGPINWDLALDTARQTIRGAGDASLTEAERTAVGQAVELAEHWLDESTTLPPGASHPLAWNRAEWLDGTLPIWKKFIEPVAAHVVEAMGKSLPEQAQQAAGPLGGMLTQAGGAMFGAQIGQALGQLATEVFGATDIGLPLGPGGRAVLLPANVVAFGEGLGVREDDVRLYLALRECAHQRLFLHAPWLTARLVSTVEEYAAGMQVDMSRLESTMGELDLSHPEALQEALSGGLFEPEETPQQKVAVSRLETMLALIEGWVDDVVTEATIHRMPSAIALHEAIRRRRAVGGPAEQTFAALVGLELRPRRLRDAATVWSALRESGGSSARDGLWAHPDLLPSAEDLDDPEGFAARGSESTFDLGDLDELGDPGSQGDPGDPGNSGDPGSPGGPGSPAP